MVPRVVVSSGIMSLFGYIDVTRENSILTIQLTMRLYFASNILTPSSITIQLAILTHIQSILHKAHLLISEN